MIVYEFGQEHLRKLLFFPSTAEPVSAFRDSLDLLSRRFHVIYIAADGHDPAEKTDFESVEKTVEQTAAWLRGHGITRLAALYGLSFGGGCAMRFLVASGIPVEKAVIDAGTAPYELPKWVCRLICVKDFAAAKIGFNNLWAMKLAYPPERYTPPGRTVDEDYAAELAYLKTYSNKTIWNVFWSANNYEMPAIVPKLDTQMEFWCGTLEDGGRRRDLNWAKRYFPDLRVWMIPNMMHGEFVMTHSQEFYEAAMRFFG